jgi:4-oxalocrotonate tautomerase
VSFEEIEASRWRDEVYLPDIIGRPNWLYKKPGYTM